jgi:pyruvate dehydrogenase E1 component beta subunit
MQEISFRDALNQALDEELARDDKVFLMGEEVAEYNGAYKVSQGLLDKYGERRIIDTPITELSFAGVGVGSAMLGLRPVIEMMTWNFAILALDQIINSAAKMRLMSAGAYDMPLTIRGPNGAAHMLSAQHSQACENWLCNVPGLKVVMPSCPNDGKGLLKASIRDDDPVMFLESEIMYNNMGPCSDADDYVIPLGQCDVKRQGTDITLVSYSKGMVHALAAAEIMAQQGVSCEVIDLMTLKPLDMETIRKSVKKTNRCVTIEESWPYGGLGAELTYRIQSQCFDWLDAPVIRVTGLDVPMPYAENLESLVMPNAHDVITAINTVMYRS